jgi:hypothetical protein
LGIQPAVRVSEGRVGVRAAARPPSHRMKIRGSARRDTSRKDMPCGAVLQKRSHLPGRTCKGRYASAS